jgi:uncharacterized damage-inducible protein DinB
MKPESAKDLIDKLEADVERQLQWAIASFQNLPTEKLEAKPDTGGWSMAQCFAHLNSYSQYYLPRVEQGLRAQYPYHPMFRSTWLGRYFTNMIRPSGKIKKYKAIKQHEPAADVSGTAAVAEFIENQERLLKLLAKSGTTDLNKIKIPISILPWIKLRLGDVFQFVIAHQERHLQQAGRML